MQILKEKVIHDEKCSYLEERLQSTHYQVIDDCTIEHCSTLIHQGWRRFGAMFFRPICPHCEACESVRIDVKKYNFSKSERRVLRKNEDIDIYVGHPTISHEHLALHERYHRFMQEKKGWDYTPTTTQHYYSSFVHGHEDYGHEVLYMYKNKLIGVDIIDFLLDGISSTYFFYDPAFEKRSLGKLSLLKQIEFAKEKGLDWIYLGYYVKDCDSLNYKADYQPQETLQGRPDLHQHTIWK
ncbi:MAG: arginyltransferase [Thiovulaceae bacterium]|nr:arginyltransferase [Sulfurimonadaceae bacterium]